MRNIFVFKNLSTEFPYDENIIIFVALPLIIKDNIYYFSKPRNGKISLTRPNNVNNC